MGQNSHLYFNDVFNFKINHVNMMAIGIYNPRFYAFPNPTNKNTSICVMNDQSEKGCQIDVMNRVYLSKPGIGILLKSKYVQGINVSLTKTSEKVVRQILALNGVCLFLKLLFIQCK